MGWLSECSGATQLDEDLAPKDAEWQMGGAEPHQNAGSEARPLYAQEQQAGCHANG